LPESAPDPSMDHHLRRSSRVQRPRSARKFARFANKRRLRPLLLVAAGRRASDAAAVRGHAGEDRDAAGAGGISRAQSGAIFDDSAGLAGEVSGDAPGKRIISGRCVLAGGGTGLFRRRWEHRRPIPADTLAERGRPAYMGVEIGESKRKFRLTVPRGIAVLVREARNPGYPSRCGMRCYDHRGET
jgi:hypothetical protein